MDAQYYVFNWTRQAPQNAPPSRQSEVSQRQAADDEVGQAWTDGAGSVFDWF